MEAREGEHGTQRSKKWAVPHRASLPLFLLPASSPLTQNPHRNSSSGTLFLGQTVHGGKGRSMLELIVKGTYPKLSAKEDSATRAPTQEVRSGEKSPRRKQSTQAELPVALNSEA